MKSQLVVIFLIFLCGQVVNTQETEILPSTEIDEQIHVTCDLAITNFATLIIKTYPKIIDGTFTFPDYITFIDKLVKDVSKIGEKCDKDWEEILKIIINLLPIEEQPCAESVFQTLNQAHLLIQSLSEGHSIFKLYKEAQQLVESTQNSVNTCAKQELITSLPFYYENLNNCISKVQQMYPDFVNLYENSKGQELFGMNTLMQVFPHLMVLKQTCYDTVYEKIQESY